MSSPPPPPIRAVHAQSQASLGGGSICVVVSRADAPPVGAWKCRAERGRAAGCVQAAGGCGHGWGCVAGGCVEVHERGGGRHRRMYRRRVAVGAGYAAQSNSQMGCGGGVSCRTAYLRSKPTNSSTVISACFRIDFRVFGAIIFPE